MNSKARKSFLQKHKVYECEKCLNKGDWEGQALRLQVDHIDGNSSNDSLSNLRFLCPNCHSQTDTYTGRNAKIKNYNRPSKDEFLLLLREHSIKEISILKAVSLRVVYQWFKSYVKEDKPSTPKIDRRLTCAQVISVRNSKDSSEKIGTEYGVSGRIIRAVRRLEIYKDCN